LDRLDAFEAMLADLKKQMEDEKREMDRLKAEGREKSAAYRQYFANRLFYQMMMDRYRQYGLTE